MVVMVRVLIPSLLVVEVLPVISLDLAPITLEMMQVKVLIVILDHHLLQQVSLLKVVVEDWVEQHQ